MNIQCHIKSYIQPFERKLAIAELQALSNSVVTPLDGNLNSASLFEVIMPSEGNATLNRELAYWEKIGKGELKRTDQIRREASYLVSRNGVALTEIADKAGYLVESKDYSKRCLRYATHGLHEYRGKFFPQLVRSLTNMANVPNNGIVIDTMCGSGTTLVETVISGKNAYGLDMNPLSVFVTKVKCEALSFEPLALIEAYEKLTRSLECSGPKDLDDGHFSSLAESDRKYLESWFGTPSLLALDHIVRCIESLETNKFQRFFTLTLSNIIRRVSWQKNADLRVRKEVINLSYDEVLSIFETEIAKATKTVVAFNSQYPKDMELGKFEVKSGDARKASKEFVSLRGKVDAIITSPPYATALPYLDTDRLSLIYLKLLTRPEHRKHDLKMIGNREISERRRLEYWDYFKKNRGALPQKTSSLIEKIDTLNKLKPTGFRRRNLSALLSKYFFDMKETMTEQHDLLKYGGTLFMVVGNNRTVAGGEEVEIATVKQIIEIGKMVGFHLLDDISMDMLVSRDIFRANAQKSEHILTFRKGRSVVSESLL